MSMRVRFRDGPKTGEFVEFGDEKQTIRFGRDPLHCDVVFDLHDTKVSREHFSLVRVNGQWRLITNRKNPVFVDGREGDDDQILGDLCRLQVGIGGPSVLLEFGRESSLESTVDVGRSFQPPLATMTRQIEKSAHRAQRVALFATGLALLLAAAGFAGFKFGQSKLEQTQGAVVQALDRMSRFESEVAERIRVAKAVFRAVYDKVEPSVYRVEKRERAGQSESFDPVGTAWVAADGRLASNAHIAKLLEELKPDERLVVRGGPLLADIVSAHVHPGFDAFLGLLHDTRVFDPAVAGDLQLIPACDVAVLELAPDDAKKLGPPLPIAPRGELEKLDAGDPIAFVGFPAEGLVHAGTDATRPKPTFQVGHVTGVTDFFLGRVAPAQSEFVQFNMVSAGGASGSPLFDQEGRVVGVLNAGNFTSFDGNVRVPLGGVNYGQRADVLLELLDGKADADLSDRTARWRGEFDRLFQRGVDGLVVRLARSFEMLVRQQGLARCERTEEIFSRDGSLTQSGTDGAAHFAVEPPQDGWYLVVAVADRAVDIDTTVTWDGHTADDVLDAYYTRIALHAEAGKKLDIAVLTNAANVGPKTDFKLRVYRAVD